MGEFGTSDYGRYVAEIASEDAEPFATALRDAAPLRLVSA